MFKASIPAYSPLDQAVIHTISAPLLDALELSIHPGETLCLQGPSGVGKTTLLNILAGLERPLKEVWGAAIPSIGYMFQQPRLLPWRTVLQNLMLVESDRARAMALLDAVGLADQAMQYPSRLSLGMARRVALARCLLLTPDLILMDEPLASLDPETGEQMLDLIDVLVVSDPERHLLYVSHNPSEARLADRVLTLSGAPACLTEAPQRFQAAAQSVDLV